MVKNHPRLAPLATLALLSSLGCAPAAETTTAETTSGDDDASAEARVCVVRTDEGGDGDFELERELSISSEGRVLRATQRRGDVRTEIIYPAGGRPGDAELRTERAGRVVSTYMRYRVVETRTMFWANLSNPRAVDEDPSEVAVRRDLRADGRVANGTVSRGGTERERWRCLHDEAGRLSRVEHSMTEGVSDLTYDDEGRVSRIDDGGVDIVRWREFQSGPEWIRVLSLSLDAREVGDPHAEPDRGPVTMISAACPELIEPRCQTGILPLVPPPTL